MSIAVSCPHCETKLNVRDDMAGRRGKCPTCSQPIDIPGEKQHAADASKSSISRSVAKPAPSAAMSPEEIVTAVKEALAALAVKKPAKSGTAALVSNLSKGFHYLLPVLLIAAVIAHMVVSTPGTIFYLVLLGLLGVLAAMSILSHLAPALPKPPSGLPLDEKNARMFLKVVGEVAKRLEVPAPRLTTSWDESLYEDRDELRVGASALAILNVAEVLGVLTRDLAVQRSPGRRVARAEFNRLRRLQGDREPGEKTPLVGQLIGALGMLGRPVTWPLLVMVRATCEGELRDAELEADAIACELVGSRMWLSTIQRRRLVDYAVELAAADVPFQFVERSLRANRVLTVEENLQSLPEEVQQSILETPVDDPVAGDYRPTWQERITAVQALAFPGTLKCAAPARLLVADFEKLCKDTTWLDISRRFSDGVKRKELKA